VKTEITATVFAKDGLTLAVGTKSGQTTLFDIRGSKPLHTKQQGNGDAIRSVAFHSSVGSGSGGLGRDGVCVVSADRRLIKAWDRCTGDTSNVFLVF
jgi:ribosome biogenesis protein ENP2